MLKKLLGLVGILFLAACASPNPPAPQVADVALADRYLIGPGDTLEVVVWGNTEVSRSIVVPPDGLITTPLVEDLPATGKTSTQLARDIEERLGQFIRNPTVTVVVTGFAGAFTQQIRVLGEASEPRALQYREGMTLVDVMIEVGGLTETAAGNRASILRITKSGERKQYSVRLDDLVRDGDVSANVEMAPGDVVIIPESFL